MEIEPSGHMVAPIVPARRTERRPGYWAERVRIQPDFDELPDDIAAAFCGEQQGSDHKLDDGGRDGLR